MFTSERLTLRRSLIALSVVAALALPVVAISVVAEHQGASIHIESGDGPFGARMTASFNEAGRKLVLKTSGEVSFNDAEDDIATIGNGGSFSIVETRGGVKRALSIASDEGKIARHYRVDGKPHAYDAAAKQWLAQTLPDVFRRTGLDAEARARRIHARPGSGRPARGNGADPLRLKKYGAFCVLYQAMGAPLCLRPFFFMYSASLTP